MGKLGMTDYEEQYLIDSNVELVNLYGIDAKFYQYLNDNIDFYNDSFPDYLPPSDINILFETNPKPILKKMDWYTEDQELPYIAYITIKDSNNELVQVNKGCMVELSSTQYNKITKVSVRKFLISEVSGSHINPLYYTCKLVPYRKPVTQKEVIDPETPVKDSNLGYNYIQRDRKTLSKRKPKV